MNKFYESQNETLFEGCANNFAQILVKLSIADPLIFVIVKLFEKEYAFFLVQLGADFVQQEEKILLV